MSGTSVVVRLPALLRERLTLATATPPAAQVSRTEIPAGGRGTLAAVADDVSPPVHGELRHFVW